MQSQKDDVLDMMLARYGEKVVQGMNRDVIAVNKTIRPTHLKVILENLYSRFTNNGEDKDSSQLLNSQYNHNFLYDLDDGLFANIDQVMDVAVTVCKYQDHTFMHDIYDGLFCNYGCHNSFEVVTRLMKELGIKVVDSLPFSKRIQVSKYFADYGRVHFHSSQRGTRSHQEEWIDIPNEYKRYLERQRNRIPSTLTSRQRKSSSLPDAYVSSIFIALELFLHPSSSKSDVGSVEHHILELMKNKREDECFFAVLRLSSVGRGDHDELVRFTYHQGLIETFMSDETFGETLSNHTSGWYGIPQRFLMFLTIHMKNKHNLDLRQNTKMCRRSKSNLPFCMMHNIYLALNKNRYVKEITSDFDILLLMLIAMYGIKHTG